MQRKDNTLRITLRGAGITIVKGTVDETLWQSITELSSRLHTAPEHAIFDAEFFGLLNHPRLKSWRQLDNLYRATGLYVHPHSMVEIKTGAQARTKVLLSDVTGESVLFPIYRSQTSEPYIQTGRQKTMTVVETEVGALCSYKITAPDFRPEDLLFSFHRIRIGAQSYTVLNKIYYKDNPMPRKTRNRDTMVNGLFALVEN